MRVVTRRCPQPITKKQNTERTHCIGCSTIEERSVHLLYMCSLPPGLRCVSSFRFGSQVARDSGCSPRANPVFRRKEPLSGHSAVSLSSMQTLKHLLIDHSTCIFKGMCFLEWGFIQSHRYSLRFIHNYTKILRDSFYFPVSFFIYETTTRSTKLFDWASCRKRLLCWR